MILEAHHRRPPRHYLQPKVIDEELYEDLTDRPRKRRRVARLIIAGEIVALGVLAIIWRVPSSGGQTQPSPAPSVLVSTVSTSTSEAPTTRPGTTTTAAPGVREILTVGKLCYEVREEHYDLVVVDAVATGHIIGQLTAPQAIQELVHVGVVSDQTRWMRTILEDPVLTGLIIVTTTEEMPVVETIELASRVHDETKVELAAVVVNRVLPELFGRAEEDVFDRLRGAEPSARLRAEAGPGVHEVFDAAELAVSLRRRRTEYLAALRDALPPSLPMLFVPELFARATGMRATSQVASALAEELS